MLIIYNKLENRVIQNMGTNSLFPKGNIPNLPRLSEGQLYLKCDDNSENAKKIMLAYEYKLEFDENNFITKVEVLKTLDEFRKEQETETVGKELSEIEKMNLKMDGLQLAIAELSKMKEV